MTRWNVEMKYQTTVEADTQVEAYKKVREEVMKNPSEIFGSHCKKVK